jgi:hypothetical protein
VYLVVGRKHGSSKISSAALTPRVGCCGRLCFALHTMVSVLASAGYHRIIFVTEFAPKVAMSNSVTCCYIEVIHHHRLRAVVR